MNQRRHSKKYRKLNPIYHQPQHVQSPQNGMNYMFDAQPYTSPIAMKPPRFLKAQSLGSPSPHSRSNSYYDHQPHQPHNFLHSHPPKSVTSDLSAMNYCTPSVTPNSTTMHHAMSAYNYPTNHSHQQQLQQTKILSPHSNYSKNNNDKRLPTIKYYQNYSNNSNSTAISSSTNMTNTTTTNKSSYSDTTTTNMTPSRTLLQLQSSYSQSDIIPNHQMQMPMQMQAQPSMVQYHPYDALPSSAMIYNHNQQHIQQQPIQPLLMTRHQSLISQSNDPHTPRINIMELDQMQNDIYKQCNDDEKKGYYAHSAHSYTQSRMSQVSIASNKQSELHCFNNDIRAYNVWIACKHSDQCEFIIFNALYPKICSYFSDIVGSNRYPTFNELLGVFIKHGAMANKYKNDANDDQNNVIFSIDREHFMSFWNWFKACSLIIRELRFLWNTNELKTTKGCKNSGILNGLGIDFFAQRAQCEHNLMQSVEGTFGLRLSSTIIGGVVLSYVDHKYQDLSQKKKCKHVLLIRQNDGMYLCNKKIMSLHDIIRNFVKLKFLYTPNRPIPKNKIF